MFELIFCEFGIFLIKGVVWDCVIVGLFLIGEVMICGFFCFMKLVWGGELMLNCFWVVDGGDVVLVVVEWFCLVDLDFLKMFYFFDFVFGGVLLCIICGFGFCIGMGMIVFVVIVLVICLGF